MPNNAYIITGAASNLGRAFVKSISLRSDANLVATTRSSARLSEFDERSGSLYLPGLDLLREGDLASLVSAVRSFAGARFNIVNCSGYFPGFRGISETDPGVMRKVYEANVLTVYSVAHALLPLMAERGGGHFVAFSSHAVLQSYPLMSAFTSAKAALESLIRSIANEFGRDGVTASAFALATIDCAQERELSPNGDFEHWLKPEQVVQIVESFVEGQSSALNGNTIQMYNYSDTYFGQSYYDRIGRKLR